VTPTQILLLAGAGLAAVSLWLLLPPGGTGVRRLGIVLGAASLVCICWEVPRLQPWTSDGVFLVLAAVTVVSAVGAVTLRSPVYCAIWFAMTLLGTSGLFLFQGAQFLGVATIVVYAGAILVTFLFVLMLAQPQGYAYYDRISWEATFSAIAGAGMVLILTTAVSSALAGAPAAADSGSAASENGGSDVSGQAVAVAPMVDPATPRARAGDILSDDHMEHLGAQLFSKHLIAVEVAGTMLLAALVGAVAIAVHHRQVSWPSDASNQGPAFQGGSRHG
jgi:NADH-quinone oxidoreductase subunit J